MCRFAGNPASLTRTHFHINFVHSEPDDFCRCSTHSLCHCSSTPCCFRSCGFSRLRWFCLTLGATSFLFLQQRSWSLRLCAGRLAVCAALRLHNSRRRRFSAAVICSVIKAAVELLAWVRAETLIKPNGTKTGALWNSINNAKFTWI